MADNDITINLYDEQNIVAEVNNIDEESIIVNLIQQPDIVIEMGEQGPRGIQGETGPQGPIGPTGPQGEAGIDTVYVGTEEPIDSRYNVWIDTDGGSNVDTQMSDVSVNPVENKVIKAYVDSKTDGIDNLATKQELTNGLNTKQDKGDYALAEDIPTLVSQLQNDTDYQTRSEVLALIAQIPQFSISIVSSLPSTGNSMTIYLVAKEGSGDDVYNEYVWVENSSTYEFIGSTAVDLTDYVKKTDYASSSDVGVCKVSYNYGIYALSNGTLYIDRATDNSIISKNGDYKAIVPSSIDLTVKTGVTTNTLELTDNEKTNAQTWLGLDDCVRTTDIATSTKNGIVKANGSGGIKVNSAGNISTVLATNSDIDRKQNLNKVIVPANLNYAVNSVLPTMTQAEYDALATKDENLFYMIVEE